MDSDNNDDEDEQKQEDEEENIDKNLEKQLEKSFHNIKKRVFDIEPHMVNADYCLTRLKREIDYLTEDSIYREKSEYLVYSHKQVRIRYIVQLKVNSDDE
jgi:hypothetical protein